MARLAAVVAGASAAGAVVLWLCTPGPGTPARFKEWCDRMRPDPRLEIRNRDRCRRAKEKLS